MRADAVVCLAVLFTGIAGASKATETLHEAQTSAGNEGTTLSRLPPPGRPHRLPRSFTTGTKQRLQAPNPKRLEEYDAEGYPKPHIRLLDMKSSQR